MNTSNRFAIETIARQHQTKIEKELATRSLLKEAGPNVSSTKRGAWIAWRVALAVLTIAVLILLNFLH